jgi:hypothetical protein
MFFYDSNCETVTSGMVYMMISLTPNTTITWIHFFHDFCKGLSWWPKNGGYDALM